MGQPEGPDSRGWLGSKMKGFRCRIYIRLGPHPLIVTTRDKGNYIKILIYSWYTTISGWGPNPRFVVYAVQLAIIDHLLSERTLCVPYLRAACVQHAGRLVDWCNEKGIYNVEAG